MIGSHECKIRIHIHKPIEYEPMELPTEYI